jgi:hypothetical protein
MSNALQANIRDTLQLQDVELANAMNDLKGNTSRLNQFIADRKSELYNTVTSEHSDSFQKVFGDLQRATDTTKNLLYYQTRNKDLDKLQANILAKSTAEASNAAYDNQNSRRQFEINQWTVGNKTDTLFFLQLLFIYLTLTAPLIYAMNSGIIPSSVFYGVTGLFSIAVVLTLIIRYQYTSKTRDNRLWNRRRFQQMGGPPVLPNCPALTGYVADSLNNTLDQANALGSTISGELKTGLESLASQASTFSRNL